jgi:hypothetical protein
MTEVFTTYDTSNETWNVMSSVDKSCLFYGTIWQLEEWLIDNKDKYHEQN